MKKFVGYEQRATKNPNSGAYAGNNRQPAATRYTTPSAYSGVPPLHPARVGRILLAMAIDRTLPDHPMDMERIEMVISIKLRTRTLGALTVEIRHIESEIARYHLLSNDDLSSSQHHRLSHRHRRNPTLDR